MIELQVVSLIVGAVIGAAVSSIYWMLPKKRRSKKSIRNSEEK